VGDAGSPLCRCCGCLKQKPLLLVCVFMEWGGHAAVCLYLRKSVHPTIYIERCSFKLVYLNFNSYASGPPESMMLLLAFNFCAWAWKAACAPFLFAWSCLLDLLSLAWNIGAKVCLHKQTITLHTSSRNAHINTCAHALLHSLVQQVHTPARSTSTHM
jgi:hypothetical protein